MDYLADIAGSPDITEAFDRLKDDRNFPHHMLEDRIAALRTAYPSVWRAELINWLYHCPKFAAELWWELRCGHTHRERVAREAVRIVLEHRGRGGMFTGLAPNEIAAFARQFDPLRPHWVKAVLSKHHQHVDPVKPQQSVCAIAAALKPRAEDENAARAAREFLDELTEAAGVEYHPPAFLEQLIRVVESEAACTTGNALLDRAAAGAKERLRTLRSNPHSPLQEIHEFVRELITHRRVTALVARAYGMSVPFAMVHEHELAEIAAAREESGRTAEYAQTPCKPLEPHIKPASGGAPDSSPVRRAHSANLIGLAFSGGGIRSATFNLGVLQALARFDLLRHCDYISTVSGGGYIGAWFVAWMHRLGSTLRLRSPGEPPSFKGIAEDMRLRLTPARTPNTLDSRVRPIRYLREFSNYLTPRTGFFSADTWTMIAIVLRNTLLNLAVLIPLLAAALLVPRLVICLTAFLHDSTRHVLWVPGIVVVLVLIAMGALFLNLRRARPPRHAADKLRDRGALRDHAYVRVPFYAKQGGVQFLIVIPLLLSAWLTATSFWLWLNGKSTVLTSDLLLVHWREDWRVGLLQDVLPHEPWGAAIAASLAVVATMLAMWTQTSGTSRWSWRERWRALAAALALAAPAAAILAFALAHLHKIATSGSGPLAAFASEPLPGLAAILAVALAVVATALVRALWKLGRRGLQFWSVAALTAAIIGLDVSGLLWLLGVFLPQELPLPGVIGAIWPQEPLRSAALWAFWIFVFFLVIFAAARGFVHCWPKKAHAWGSLGLAVTGSAAVAFGLFWVVGKILMALPGVNGFWHAVTFGPALVLTAFSIIIAFQLGLLGSKFPDEQREWWSRLRAWTLIYSLGWCALFVAALYPPAWKQWLVSHTAGQWSGAGAVLLWLLSTFAGVKAGSSAEPEGSKARKQESFSAGGAAAAKAVSGSGRLRKLAVSVAPYIFIAGLVVGISMAIQAILDYNVPQQAAHWYYPTRYVLLATFLLTVVSVLVSWRIGVNEFSLHHFYKNRLVRCYLGASNWRERKPDWFTGFDSADDIRLKDLDRSGSSPGAGYAGPYPIINAALNLVAGEDLAWQERKAASFVFTPAYCGYDIDRAVMSDSSDGWADAYAPTRTYVRQGDGPMLGTAMAISGAAANPNMGRVTSAASAFLMTVFNVRLGWWLPNPRQRKYKKYSSPRLGLTYTAVELFGMTDDKRRYINVSDGGHFENLGVYELIRRGCRYIIASDAGQDGSFMLEDLGNLVRRCRTDFGVEIDLGVDRIRNRNGAGWSDAHCVVGRIHYLGVPRRDAEGHLLFENGKPLHEEGLLIYLKPSITGDEPFDVLEYFKRVPEFPHESTADQWFNESQFESYRRLGLHIAENAFARYRSDETTTLADPGLLFEQLYKFWHPPSPKVQQYSTEHAVEYSRVLELVRSRENLAYLDAELFEEVARRGLHMPKRDEFYVCNALIQLMENVYADLDLEQNYAHPHVEGWMAVFRRWAGQPAFRRTWSIAANTYAERFRNFYCQRLESRNGQ